MSKQFSIPLAIDGTKQEIDAIVTRLCEIGYKVVSSRNNGSSGRLCTFFNGRSIELGHTSTSSGWLRTSDSNNNTYIRNQVSASRIEMVIALASMTNDLNFHEGECITYKDPLSVFMLERVNSIAGRSVSTSPYRRCTKEEIIKHFTNTIGLISEYKVGEWVTTTKSGKPGDYKELIGMTFQITQVESRIVNFEPGKAVYKERIRHATTEEISRAIQGDRPLVGDLVVITKEITGNNAKVGMICILERDDKSNKPFRVTSKSFKDGDWCIDARKATRDEIIRYHEESDNPKKSIMIGSWIFTNTGSGGYGMTSKDEGKLFLVLHLSSAYLPRLRLDRNSNKSVETIGIPEVRLQDVRLATDNEITDHLRIQNPPAKEESLISRDFPAYIKVKESGGNKSTHKLYNDKLVAYKDDVFKVKSRDQDVYITECGHVVRINYTVPHALKGVLIGKRDIELGGQSGCVTPSMPAMPEPWLGNVQIASRRFGVTAALGHSIQSIQKQHLELMERQFGVPPMFFHGDGESDRIKYFDGLGMKIAHRNYPLPECQAFSDSPKKSKNLLDETVIKVRPINTELITKKTVTYF